MSGGRAGRGQYCWGPGCARVTPPTDDNAPRVPLAPFPLMQPLFRGDGWPARPVPGAPAACAAASKLRIKNRCIFTGRAHSGAALPPAPLLAPQAFVPCLPGRCWCPCRMRSPMHSPPLPFLCCPCLPRPHPFSPDLAASPSLAVVQEMWQPRRGRGQHHLLLALALSVLSELPEVSHRPVLVQGCCLPTGLVLHPASPPPAACLHAGLVGATSHTCPQLRHLKRSLLAMEKAARAPKRRHRHCLMLHLLHLPAPPARSPWWWPCCSAGGGGWTAQKTSSAGAAAYYLH